MALVRVYYTQVQIGFIDFNSCEILGWVLLLIVPIYELELLISRYGKVIQRPFRQYQEYSFDILRKQPAWMH
jgi:hypothetical protein